MRLSPRTDTQWRIVPGAQLEQEEKNELWAKKEEEHILLGLFFIVAILYACV